MNNTTRKYPRTMNEAFGPYASLDAPEKRPFDKQDKVVMWGCAVAAVALMVILMMEYV